MVDILSFLDGLIGSHKTVGSKHDEVTFMCPFCHHHKPKLAINVVIGHWHCWVCGTGGRTLFALLKKLNATPAQFDELGKLLKTPRRHIVPKEETPKALTLPAEYLPLWDPPKDFEHRHALYYIKQRGLTRDDIFRYQLGYCSSGDYAGRVIIPSFTADGTLNFFSGRSYRESTFPYLNPSVSKNIVGFESLLSWQFPIVMCEGPMDAMTIKRNALPLFGKTVPSRVYEQIVVQKVPAVYVALDTDALKDAVRIAQTLMDRHIPVHLVRMDGKDPNVIGFTTMQYLLRTTPPLTFNDLVALKVGLA